MITLNWGIWYDLFKIAIWSIKRNFTDSTLITHPNGTENQVSNCELRAKTLVGMRLIGQHRKADERKSGEKQKWKPDANTLGASNPTQQITSKQLSFVGPIANRRFLSLITSSYVEGWLKLTVDNKVPNSKLAPDK